MSTPELRDLAGKGTRMLEDTIVKLCDQCDEMGKHIAGLEKDKVAAQTALVGVQERLLGLEKQAEEASAVQAELAETVSRVGVLEDAVNVSRWVEMDLTSPAEFNTNGIFRISVDEMRGAMHRGWVIPTRILPSHLIFECASASSSQYFSRIASTRKARWEYLSKNSDSPSATATPVTGAVLRIQEALL